MKKVLIMAGGTGGHVIPGLSLAKYMQAQGVEVEWLGTARGIESRLVPEAGIPLHLLTIGGVRGKGILTLTLAPFKILQAMWQAAKVFKRFKPDLVVGFGGFVAGPGGLVAWLWRCPLVIHEQNAKAGVTNQFLKCLAKKVLTGFPDVFPPSPKVIFTGNPVRAEIIALPPPATRFAEHRERMRILVFGGSLGAQVINELVPACLAEFDPSVRPEVYHQAGSKLLAETLEHYRSLGVGGRVVAFIDDMSAAYAWADIVICRAGALSVAELACAGLGSILIPYPFAVDDHQTLNAQFLVKAMAALLIQQSELSKARLLLELEKFNQEPDLRLQMAQAAYSLRKPQVIETIFKLCMD